MFPMKSVTLIYSVIIIASGILGDISFAQSVPQQTGAIYTTSVTRAGRVRNPESIKKAKLTRLKKDVGLDEQQVQSAMPIIDSYVTAVQNVKNDASIDSHTRRLKLAELRKHYDSELDTILTQEQQQKLASLKAERRSRLRGAKGPFETSRRPNNPESATGAATIQ